MSRRDRDNSRQEVLQDTLDAELRRQWWCRSEEPVFNNTALWDTVEEIDDEPVAETPPAFEGLFGTIPGSETNPLPIKQRRVA